MVQKRLRLKRSTPLEQKLREHGSTLTRDEFRDILRETFHEMFPDMTDERMMADPERSLKFCKAIQRKTTKLPNELILQALVNCRKNKR